METAGFADHEGDEYQILHRELAQQLETEKGWIHKRLDCNIMEHSRRSCADGGVHVAVLWHSIGLLLK